MNLKQDNNLISGKEKAILISSEIISQVIYKSNLSGSQDILLQDNDSIWIYSIRQKASNFT